MTARLHRTKPAWGELDLILGGIGAHVAEASAGFRLDPDQVFRLNDSGRIV